MVSAYGLLTVNDKYDAISLLVKRHFLPFYEHQDEYILY